MIPIARRLLDWLEGTRRVLMVGLWATCLAAWVLVGGVHPSNQVILDSAALLLGAVALVYSLRHKRTTALRFAFWIPATLALVSALQAIPGLGRIDASTTDILTQVTVGLTNPPAPALSWDLPGTILATLHAAALAALVLSAAVVARRRGETIQFAWGLDAVLLVVAAAALVNWVTDPGRVWWAYKPLARGIRPLAPMVNENHAAGLYLMATLLHLGLSIQLPRGRKKNVMLALTLLPGFLLMLAQSRGGYAGGLAALLLFAVLLWRSRQISTTALWQGASAVALVVIGLLPSISYLREAFGASGISGIPEDKKVALWGRGLDMAMHHPWTGIGRGAYQVAITRYNDLVTGTVTHAENWFVQLSAETGLVVTALLVLMGLAGAWRFLRRCDIDPAGAGMAAALAGIFVQNLGDFNLEFAGTAFPTALLAGLLAGQCLARDRRSRRSSRRHKTHTKPSAEAIQTKDATKTTAPRKTRPALSRIEPRHMSQAGAAAILLLGLGMIVPAARWAAVHTLRKDTIQAHRLLARSSRAQAVSFLDHALSRHPADYHLQTLMAAAQLGMPKGRPLLWVNHALLLKPTAAWPHLVAARALLLQHRISQAASEYRRAFQRGIKMTKSNLAAVKRLALMLAARTKPETAALFLTQRITARAASARPLVALILSTRTKRVSDLALVTAMTKPLPEEPDPWTKLGRLLIQDGYLQPGAALLAAVARKWPDRAGVLSSLAALARRKGDLKTALWWTQRLIAVKPSPKAYLAAVTLAGRAEGKQKALDLALTGLQAFPGDVTLTARAAHLIFKQGDPDRAKKLIDDLMSTRDVPLRERPPLLGVLIEIARAKGDHRTERRLVHRLQRLKMILGPEQTHPHPDSSRPR